MSEEQIKFIDNLTTLLGQLVSRLKDIDEDIQKLKTKDDELEHQLDIIFENQVGHQDICGNS